VLELEDQNKKGALFMLARGLKECPLCGELWALAIELEPKSTRTKKIMDALNACEEDASISLAAAKFFWKERKLDKALKWI